MSQMKRALSIMCFLWEGALDSGLLPTGDPKVT